MVLIIDNGSQYTHLIKRKCRNFVDSRIKVVYAQQEKNKNAEKLVKETDKIILSGGPKSVYKQKNFGNEICNLIKNEYDKPLLGICYGHQLIAHVWGGEIEKGDSAEYGKSKIEIIEKDEIFKNISENEVDVWVSHFDEIKSMPENFQVLAKSKVCEVEAFRHKTKDIFGLQFHPEVWHTQHGEKMLENFLEL